MVIGVDVERGVGIHRHAHLPDVGVDLVGFVPATIKGTVSQYGIDVEKCLVFKGPVVTRSDVFFYLALTSLLWPRCAEQKRCDCQFYEVGLLSFDRRNSTVYTIYAEYLAALLEEEAILLKQFRVNAPCI
jgi:hypothetical protein